MSEKFSYLEAFEPRDDLKQFGPNSLTLFALQLRFGIEDIWSVGVNSITEGSDDKKADLIYIDSEKGFVVIAQSHLSQKEKESAPANKASDLNTAVSWLINTPLDNLPPGLKTHAEELRRALKNNDISMIYIWYVHNLPESVNVDKELKTVEHTARTALESLLGKNTISVHALEVGQSCLEAWYISLQTPILINDELKIEIPGGFEVKKSDWNAYLTVIPARWLYVCFKKYGTRLFSANIREYLGSRDTDKNINKGIQKTASTDPSHFLVFNNGITALVNSYKEEKGEKTHVIIKGISIVNGAQTTGSIGTSKAPPAEDALVQIRFIMCNNVGTVQDIVKYNNSQNKITAPDFRSNDLVQRRLVEEFKDLDIEYLSRRGGQEDLIRRPQNALPSIALGQVLAAFHGDPDSAYNKKTYIWEDDQLYGRLFNERTTAKHSFFAYTLFKAVERKKLELINKKDENKIKQIEEAQLAFFRNRGSTILFATAISRCLETFLDQRISNKFDIKFKNKRTIEEATDIWYPLIQIASSFTDPLLKGLSDGIKNKDKIEESLKTFESLISSTKQANAQIFKEFSENVSL